MKIAFTSLKSLTFIFLAVMFLSFAEKATEQASFSIIASVSNSVNTGSFSSTGLNLSAGDFSEDYSFNGKKVNSEATFTYADGTITAKTHSVITFTSNTSATGTGTWIITKGTGAYEKIKGSGDLTLEVTNISTDSETITQEWIGSIK